MNTAGQFYIRFSLSRVTRLNQILQAPRFGQHMEDLLLHFVDVLGGVAFAGHDLSDLHLARIQQACLA
jgi:hypothetical protein